MNPFLIFFTIAVLFVLLICACVIAAVFYISGNRLRSKNDKLQRFLKYLRREKRISDQEYFEVSGEYNAGAAVSASPNPTDVPAQVYLTGPAADPPVSLPVSIPDSKPVPVQSGARSREKSGAKSFGAINIVLIIGVIFVILSGLIFATTTWLYLSNVIRTIIICSLAFVFFGASITAENAFRIRKTAVAFYTLGSIFLPICILATGFFRLFGDWFSLSGGGKYLLYLSASVLLGAASFIGSMKYRHGYFGASFLLCITGVILFAVKSLYLPYDIFILIMFLYCAVITFVSELLAKKESLKRGFGHIVSLLRLFAVLNVGVIGVIGLLTTGTGLLPGISAMLLGTIFLKGLFQHEDRYWGVFAYAVFVIAGFMKCNVNGEFSNSVMLASISSAVIILSGMMNVFPAKMKKYLSIVGGIWACLVFIWQLTSIVAGEEKWTLFYLLGTAVLLANVIWVAVLQKSKIFMSAMPFVAAVLIIGFCDYLSLTTFPSGLIMTLLAAAVFGTVFLLDKRTKSFSPRTAVSDIIFPLMCLAGGLVDIRTEGVSAAAVSVHSPLFASASLLSFLILITLSMILTFEKKRSAAGWIFAFGLPHFLLLLLLPGQVYYAGQINIITLQLVLYGITAIAASAGIVLQKRQERWKRIKIPFAIAMVLYGILVPLVEWVEGTSNLYPVYLWILTAYFILRLSVLIRTSQGKNRKYETAMLDYAAGSGLFLAVTATSAAMMPSAVHGFYVFLVPSAAAVLLLATYTLLKYSGKVSREKLTDFYHVICVGLHVFAVITVLLFLFDQSVVPMFGFAADLLLIACLASLYIERNTAAGWIGVMLLYTVPFAVLDKLAVQPGSVPYIVGLIGVFTGMAIAGRLLHRDVFSRAVQGEGKGKAYIDWFTIVNITGAAALIFSGGKTGAFWGSVLLVFYAMTFFRRVKTSHADDIVLTFAAAFGCLAYWLQPFLHFPGLLSTELNLVPFILFFFFLNKFLWRKAVKVTGVLFYISACLGLAVLAIDAVYSGEVSDAIIIGVISFLVFAGAFRKKSKRWFVMSALTLIILAIYMSRSFWLSIAWWVYLLVAGLALIVLAAVNEASKQNGSSLSQKVADAFEDWEL